LPPKLLIWQAGALALQPKLLTWQATRLPYTGFDGILISRTRGGFLGGTGAVPSQNWGRHRGRPSISPVLFSSARNLHIIQSLQIQGTADLPKAGTSRPFITTTTGSIAVVAAAFSLLWFGLCRALSSEWRLNEQYNYGWFVPIFAAYLFWLRWQDRPAKSQISRFRYRIGATLVVGAAIILLPIRLFEVANPDWRPLGWLHAGVVVGMTLIFFWITGGTAWLRHFAFPIAFVFVAVPWLSAIEQPIVQGLMRAIAGAAAETISLFGVPAEVHGNLIRLSNGVVGVNEACSGVRSLQTSIMIGLLFGELKRLTVLRRIVLVGIAVAIALFANFLRALLLVSIAARENLAAIGRWHDLAGYAIVALVFAGTMIIAWRMGNKAKSEGRRAKGREQTAAAVGRAFLPAEPSEPGKRERLPYNSHLPSSIFLLLFVWLVAIEVGVELWYRSHERTMSPTPRWTIRWPEDIAGFRDVPIDEGVRATLRFDQGREATWTAKGTADSSPLRCFLFFFRWNPGGSSVVRARAHRPDICLPAAGWQQRSDTNQAYFVNDRLSLPFRRVDFVQPNSGVTAHTFFCLQEDRRTNEARPDLELPAGIQPEWSFPARWRAVRDGVRNMGQQMIELIILAPSQLDDAAVDQQFAAILATLVVPES
jgi:exosortase